MDTLRITSALMRRLVSKVINKIIFKKSEVNANVNVRSVDIKFDDESAVIHLDLDAELSKDDLLTLINGF